MKIQRTILTAAVIAAAASFAALPAQAFDAPKNTIFTVTDPIRVGHTTLNAGTYVIRVVEHLTDINLLQVTDRDLMTVYATFQARQHSLLDSEVSADGTLYFAGAPGTPNLLRSWDLPNRSFGYDIVTSTPKTPSTATIVVKGPPVVRAAR
jgi:hypothetical protein